MQIDFVRWRQGALVAEVEHSKDGVSRPTWLWRVRIAHSGLEWVPWFGEGRADTYDLCVAEARAFVNSLSSAELARPMEDANAG